MREQSNESKRSSKVNEKREKVSKEKYLKADISPKKEREKQAEKITKKRVAEQYTPSPGSTQEDSEDEESDSDDSSEGEEDRDSEQKSSNEEEETEPDDESSPDTSEEEVKRKPAVPYMKERVKETGGTKGKRVKSAAGVPDLPGDENQSDPGGRDQEEQDPQPKRRRHRESSMSPTTRGSSFPSTSQEESQRSKGTPKPKGKGRKNKDYVKKTGTKEGLSSSTDTEDSPPDCDMLCSSWNDE